ncbi:MAG: dihydropteroate synthase [Verrucomicrobiota bacterium]
MSAEVSGGEVATKGRVARSSLIEFPRVMGIVNINDDSFSGDGTLDVEEALRIATEMASEGADIIDVGAESARTNRGPISASEEIDRLLPFLDAFPSALAEISPRDDLQIWPPLVSVNSWRPEVIEAVLQSGRVDLVNDIGGLVEDTNARLCFEYGCALLIMHTVGQPKVAHTTQDYESVWESVLSFFEDRIAKARRVGLGNDQIILDPGIDFAKQCEHNLALYHDLERLTRFELPILLPISRKTVIGDVLGVEDPSARDAGTIACLVRGLVAQANIFRVHNVKAVADSVRVIAAIGLANGHSSSFSASGGD